MEEMCYFNRTDPFIAILARVTYALLHPLCQTNIFDLSFLCIFP